jgi:hypothetical protein
MSLQPFRFLDLPPEIRQKIYTLICTSPLPYIPLDDADARSCFPSDLLLANTQIYHEIRPVYFFVNAFCVTVRRQNPAWEYFLNPAFQDNRRQIRSLAITLVRWGSRDFFQETLIPLLEDCILNGRLRFLEFRVSMKWFNSQGRRVGVGDYVVEGGTSLDIIRKILADPYLERGMLKAWVNGDFNQCPPPYDAEFLTLKDVTGRLFELRELVSVKYSKRVSI